MNARMFPIYLVSIMAGFLFWAQSTVAGQFTADMVETYHGTDSLSRIAIKNDRYRISTREDSEEVNVIVDESRGKTWVLVPSRRIVLEKDINDPQNLVKNPFQAFRYMVQKYGSTRDGLEQINGYRCDRIIVMIQGKKAATAWMAEKLAFPIKIVNHINKRTVELKSIREKQIDNSFFKVPSEAGQEQASSAAAATGQAAQSAADAQPAVAAPSVKSAHAAGTSVTNGAASVIFILDASGSMWGRVHGEPKIVIAKSVMSDLIDRLPTDMRVGLMAYGHRRKGDCRDIETLVPVSKRDAEALKANIKALNPKGKTPLSATVEQAAENLRYTEERATVVLVSDGLETCNADPCKLAEKLAMHGVDFTVHVIGFDLSKAEQARLRCLSDKTGGLFLAASDAGALRSALLKTVEKVTQPPPVVKETPGTAKLDGPDNVPAGAAFAIKWQGPDSLRDYIAISKKGSEDNLYVDYVYTKTGNPVRMTAPGDTGAYELRYIYAHSGKVIGCRDIRVTPVKAQVLAPASVAVATKFSVQWQGPAYPADFLTIARPDQDASSYLEMAYIRGSHSIKLRAPADPGTYEVRYIMGHGAKLLAKTAITVKPVTAKVEAPVSVSAASRFSVHWQGPGDASDLITIARPDQSATSYLGVSYVSGGNPVKLRAPADPGTYEVRYIMGHGAKLLAKTPLTVKPVSAKLEAPAKVNAGTRFQVKWQGPGNEKDMIMLAAPDQGATSFLGIAYVYQGNPVTLTAPKKPGAYEVRYILYNGAKLLARVPIIVTAP